MNRSSRKKNNNKPMKRQQLRVESQQLSVLKDIRDYTSQDTFGRVPSVPDVPRIHLKSNKVYTFSRSYEYLPGITATAGAPGMVGVQFLLSDTPSYTEFSSLFDQYRIVQATVTYVPVFFTNTVNVGTVYSVIDYDDAATPSSQLELLQKETLQLSQMTQIFSRTVNPCIDTQVFPGLTGTGYSVDRLKWIDSANASVPHYGMKYYVDGLSGTGTLNARLVVDLIIQGRSVS